MMEQVMPVLIAIISGGLFSFITFLITRKDNRNTLLNEVIRNQKEMKLELLRLRILNLIQHEPKNKDTILTSYDEYNRNGGNSFISDVIKNWENEYCIKH